MREYLFGKALTGTWWTTPNAALRITTISAASLQNHRTLMGHSVRALQELSNALVRLAIDDVGIAENDRAGGHVFWSDQNNCSSRHSGNAPTPNAARFTLLVQENKTRSTLVR